MQNNWKKAVLTGIILLTYTLLFYVQTEQLLNIDFTSFYASVLAYSQDINPYQDLPSIFLSSTNKLPTNLNPPAFLQIAAPLVYIKFWTLVTGWFFISLILGICGALISLYILSTREYFKKNWLIFTLIYLAMYPTLMNASITQLASLLFFFIMAGSYFFLRKYDYWAGLFWGFIIAIKLFPGLLFFFVYQQKRHKVFFTKLITCLLVSLLPLLSKDISIYSNYFGILQRVTWYGSSWNASFNGVLFRLFTHPGTDHILVNLKIVYWVIFIILFIWYIKKLYLFEKHSKHHAFCLTLVMMLLMSPLGWFYYFPLLFMPLILIWNSLCQTKVLTTKSLGLWAVCPFLINFPTGNMLVKNMENLMYKTTFYSIYFYGLLLIIYLLNQSHANNLHKFNSVSSPPNHLIGIELSLTLGVLLTLCQLLSRLIL